jgi:enolase
MGEVISVAVEYINETTRPTLHSKNVDLGKGKIDTLMTGMGSTEKRSKFGPGGILGHPLLSV